MRYFYCANNDIVIAAINLKKARDYAVYRLSPAYDHAPGRADNLNLQPISASRYEDLEGSSITWDLSNG